MAPPLHLAATQAFFRNPDLPLDSPKRFLDLANTLAVAIRSWAPPHSESPICHLAVNEVADRLIEEALASCSPHA